MLQSHPSQRGKSIARLTMGSRVITKLLTCVIEPNHHAVKDCEGEYPKGAIARY